MSPLRWRTPPEACNAASEAYNAGRPAMPDMLRHRIDDHWASQYPAGIQTICDDRASDFYNNAKVYYLRTIPHRTEDGSVNDVRRLLVSSSRDARSRY